MTSIAFLLTFGNNKTSKNEMFMAGAKVMTKSDKNHMTSDAE